MTNCSPGLVIIFIRIWMAKSPNCVDTLHLQRLENVRRELRVGEQLLADLLDDLLHLVEIGIVGDADRQLVDHPVAAHVLDRTRARRTARCSSGPRWWRSLTERSENDSTVPL